MTNILRNFLAQNPISNGLILGLLRRETPLHFSRILQDEKGESVFAAVQTDPEQRLLLSEGDVQYARRLAHDLLTEGYRFPGVMGPKILADAFAKAYQAVAVVTPAIQMFLRGVYQHEFASPTTLVPSGCARLATEADFQKLQMMRQAFVQDTGVFTTDLNAYRQSTRQGIAAEKIWLWEVKNGAFGGYIKWSNVNAEGAKIGHVYTAPAHRGQGIASHLMAHVLREIFDHHQKQWCVLFSNTENPTSNRVYERLGFHPYGTYQEYNFGLQK